MRRTGIDLSATSCNVVDAELAGRRRGGDAATLRIHQFATVPHTGSESALTSELQALVEGQAFPRRAWVNLWEVRSSHQYLLLPSAGASELDAAARQRGASALGVDGEAVTVAAAFGKTRGEPGHHPRQEVSIFAAASDEVLTRLRPIIDAGFTIEGVTTPCGALWAQARLRRSPVPGEVHAYVALGDSQAALGIFSDGMLLYARDLDWGYGAPLSRAAGLEGREVLAGRLAEELRRSFLYLKQYWETEPSQVVLCGEMPEMRSLTAPLIEKLNVEVETLDTLEGVEPAELPDGAAEHLAALRLASAIAVDPPPVNLLPAANAARGRRVRAGMRAVAGGAAAAVVLAAVLYAQAELRVRAAERQLALIEREAETPAPEIARAGRAETADVESARRSALSALDAQGPVLARALEALADATPAGARLTSVRMTPDGRDWVVRLEALASGRDGASARHAGERMVESISQLAVSPPTRRVIPTSDGVAVAIGFRMARW